jgi:hypothetical protein
MNSKGPILTILVMPNGANASMCFGIKLKKIW